MMCVVPAARFGSKRGNTNTMNSHSRTCFSPFNLVSTVSMFVYITIVYCSGHSHSVSYDCDSVDVNPSEISDSLQIISGHLHSVAIGFAVLSAKVCQVCV